MNTQKPPHLLVMLIVLVVAMLAACLWPFNFRPSNQVHWLPDGRGVRFSGLGYVVSREDYPQLAQLASDRSITVEVAVRPGRIATRHAPYILSFHPDSGPAPLVIGGWKSSAIVRVGRTGGSGTGRYREIGVRDAFVAGKVAVVTVVAGPQGTSVYLDGRLQVSAPLAAIAGETQPLGRLLLGISPTATSEWRGDILGLKIFNRALSAGEVLTSHEASQQGGKLDKAVSGALIANYAFREGSGHVVHDGRGQSPDLVIPEVFQPLRRVFLSWGGAESRWNRSAVGDVALNLLGFMPYAFLAMWFLRTPSARHDGWRATAVVLSGFLLSFVIEFIQAFLPTRSSSLVDLCANTAGTAIGVMAFFALGAALEARYSRPRPPSSGLR